MPIIFITINESFAAKSKQMGFDTRVMKIEDYEPNPTKHTYYVSPANSICFMDGGIDYALSRIVFPGIEPIVRNMVQKINHTNRLGPIGSSIIFASEEDHKSLIVAPTMLWPQNVSNTNNAYYATIAVLYNILVNKKEKLEEVDILLTSFCCGYGKMNEEDSLQQMMNGIRDYTTYFPTIYNENIIINEPNLHQQPKYYQNTEWLYIRPENIQPLE